MNSHADKTPENKSKAVANNSEKQEIGGESWLHTAPETIAQRKLQEAINNSPRVQQLKAYKAMADQFTSVSVQRKEKTGEELLQAKHETLQKKKNDTGLPDNLKSGIENLSGYSMDDVKVHYNSDKPSQLQAYAYAQGTDIHLGSGQEKHLAHEAWHVVQQKQGRVKPTMQMKGAVNINDDAALEHEADVMGEKALTLTTTQLRSLSQAQPVNMPSQPVQRAIVPAKVTWAVTHVVKEMDGSIFGGENFEEGEIGPLGELTAGQTIVINDDDIFISRRGSNQEVAKNRKEQGEEERPSVPWVRVLEIHTPYEAVNVVGRNVYVKAETVKIQEKEKEKSKEEFKKVQVTEVEGLDESMELAVHKMETEWLLMGGNPKKPKGDKECSGAHWNQVDEGADVSHDLADPDERENTNSIGNYQRTFIAHYEGERDPIAVMILEMRKDERKSKEPYLYIRWLVGSPKRKGGGSALVNMAKLVALKDAKGQLRVESAKSAEEWYQKLKFVTKYNSKHGEDIFDNQDDDDEYFDTLEDCGCKFMTWTGE